MPKTHTHTTYSYEELSQEAKTKAVEVIRDMFAGPWWDEYDNKSIEETILYSLAASFQHPGLNDHGPGDFPGINGLEIVEWGLHPPTLKLGGCLTKDSAPALPWANGGEQYAFGTRDHGDYLDWGDLEYDESYSDRYKELAGRGFDDAIQNAISEALKAGEAEYEYKTSEEYARERCEDGDWEFNEDGTLHR